MKAGRHILAIAVALAVASSLSAQLQLNEQVEAIARPERGPATIGDLVQHMQSAVRASVVAVDYSTDSFIIPVAGNAAGGGGTYFRSDVVFNNDRLVEQRIAVGWMAAGQNNCAAPLQYFVLSPNSITSADDFVNASLHKSGLGALLVVSVTATGSFDDDGEIDGYSRIWTPQPGSNGGTVSQNFAAISVTDSIGSLTATLMGLKQNNQFRANVGIVNLDQAEHTWTFTSIANGKTTTFAVPPCSLIHTGVTAGSASASGNLALSVKSNGFGFWWSGYGSSTDNTTGDGWVARAIQ